MGGRFAWGTLLALLLVVAGCKPTMELHSARFAGAAQGLALDPERILLL